MKNDYTITAGQNLKKIRKELGLKQYEIVGKEVTRNLISLIENGKATLFDNTASIIAKNINEIMNEKGFHFYIKPEDILNPERYEDRKKADIYIEELEDVLDKQNFEIELDKLNKIEAFLNEGDLVDKKVKIYELLGDIYYNSKNLNKEYYYYFKALEASYDYPNMKNRYKLALKQIFNCIVTEKYEEAINLCSYMLLSQKDIPNRSKGVLYYNSALSYYNLEKFEICLKELDNAKNFIDDKNYDNFNKLLILEGICYSNIKNYDYALKSYNKTLEILDKKNNIEELCVAYINIIQIYMKIGNESEIIKYFDKAMIILPYINENSFYLPKIYFEVSNIYYYLKKYDACENYLNTALVLSKINGDNSTFTKTLSKLLDLYIKMKWFDKLSDLIETYESKIDTIKLNEEFILILKLLLFYIKQDNPKVAEDLILSLLYKEKEGMNNED